MRAARAVFSERGYEAATFQAIAERADLTRPAINHYFSSKRLLYGEVLEETNSLVVVAAVECAQQKTSLIARLLEFITAATRGDVENPSSAAFLLTAVLETRRNPELRRPENDSLRATRDFLTRAVQDAIQRGELNANTDLASLTEMLVAVLCGVGFYAEFIGSRQQVGALRTPLQQLISGTLGQQTN